MIPPAIMRHLVQPALTAELFVPTSFHSAEEKAQFGNALLKFIASDFPESQFTGSFYRRLHNSFGHIAHYDRNGFFGTYFLGTASKIDFLDHTLKSAWLSGDPAFTFSDVEAHIRQRVARSGVLDALKMQLVAETTAKERATLARLKAKYEASLVGAPPPPMPTVQCDLFDSGR